MTQLSRRLFLRTAPAAVAATALAPRQAFAGAGESPEFLEAVHASASALATYDDVIAAKNAALEFFQNIAPSVPASVKAMTDRKLGSGYYSGNFLAERLIDGELNDVWENRSGQDWPVYIAASWLVSAEADRLDGQWAITKKLRQIAADALAYENAFEAARDRASLPTICEAHYCAESDLQETIALLAKTPAVSLRGALLKAQAWTALCARMPRARGWSYATAIVENVGEILLSGGVGK